MASKCSLVAIFFIDDDLVILCFEINGRVNSISGYLVKDLVDQWYWVDVLEGGIVQRSIINTIWRPVFLHNIKVLGYYLI